MPTAIGIVFFCLSAYYFFRSDDGLFGLLMLSIVFEASSAINILERGIQPYYVVATFTIVRALANWASRPGTERRMPQGAWLIMFGAVAVASAFVCPILFAGVPVYDPKIGVDDGLLIQPPLGFGLNNLAQAGFLIWHICTAFAVLNLDLTADKTRKLYLCAFYIAATFIFAQSMCQLIGIQFPYAIILNNPGYALWSDFGHSVAGTRNPGTFAEPSLVGGFLVLYSVGFIKEYLSGEGGGLRVLTSLAASAGATSSGSMLVLTIFIFALALQHFPLRLPWYINTRELGRIGWILLLIIAPAALALSVSGSFREAMIEATVSKGDSGSFFNRTASDLFALRLFVQTHGAGVGLGSNRSSSMLASLLSTVGLAGTLCFGTFYVRLFTHLPHEYHWLKWGAFGLLANMFLDISDVTMPMLWLPIFLAIIFSTTPEFSRLERQTEIVAVAPTQKGLELAGS